jgi:nucleoside-diphosphate-sugar epimerase
VSVLVTGATGFLGPALVERLLARDEEQVVAVVRPGRPAHRLRALVGRHGPRLRLLTGTLSSLEEAARVLAGSRPEVVYHAAAALRGAPADLFLNTVVTSKHLLEAAVRASRKPRFVLVSSFSVYGVADRPRGSRIDEETPLETHPERRDPYSQAKLRQERLFAEYGSAHALEIVIMRPGVLYGPGGSPIPNRVGIAMPGLFLALAGSNVLPLSYVDNCGEALAMAGREPTATGRSFNVHDDDLPTAREFIRRYRREVAPLRVLPLPYWLVMRLAWAIQRYHQASQGQVPAVLTPYKVASMWKGNRFDNTRLKSIGWRPLVSTEEGLRRHFAALREAPTLSRSASQEMPQA